MKTEDIKIGQTVTVKTWGGGNRVGVVDDIEIEGKNGRDTIGFVLSRDCGANEMKGDACWAYVDQIIG